MSNHRERNTNAAKELLSSFSAIEALMMVRECLVDNMN